jgi:hypothetical protein
MDHGHGFGNGHRSSQEHGHGHGHRYREMSVKKILKNADRIRLRADKITQPGKDNDSTARKRQPRQGRTYRTAGPRQPGQTAGQDSQDRIEGPDRHNREGETRQQGQASQNRTPMNKKPEHHMNLHPSLPL